jgi:hypothetical protein
VGILSRYELSISDHVSLLLSRTDRLLRDIVVGHRLRGHLLMLTLVMMTASAPYGAVLGLWRSPLMSLYAAIKLPFLLVGTSVVTMSFNWVIARAFSVRLTFMQVAVLTVGALAAASLVLASLTPIAWLFTVCAPQATEDARATHNLLFVTHTALISACGIVGSRTLWQTLVSVSGKGRGAVGTYVAWLVMFGFVAGELGWLLRPFVGSIYFPVAFLRGDSLDRNVYEFMWTDIVRRWL